MDALHAIAGALNSFRDQLVYHIWGVPFSGREHGGAIALPWAHSGPCRRRADFPSWSSVGWTGSHLWPDDDLVSVWNIALFIHGSYTPLVDFAPSIEESSADDARKLVITLGVANLSSPYGMKPITYDPRGTHQIAVAFDEEYKVLYQPSWDVISSDLGDGSGIRAMLLPGSSGSQDLARCPDSRDSIMLIRPFGAFYERIGLFRPEDQRIYDSDGVEIVQPLLPNFLVSDNNFKILKQDNVRDMVKRREKWWRKYFKEETIVLA